MEPKTVKESTVCLSRLMLPEDANPIGIVHGGAVMKEIDNAAGVVAVRHSGNICVTASINSIDFHNQTFIGNLLSVKGSINYSGRSSMEIGVRVEAEDLLKGEVKHVASAYLTFVALGDDNRGVAVPGLILGSPDEVRRNSEAKSRRKFRQSLKHLEKNYDEKEKIFKELVEGMQ